MLVASCGTSSTQLHPFPYPSENLTEDACSQILDRVEHDVIFYEKQSGDTTIQMAYRTGQVVPVSQTWMILINGSLDKAMDFLSSNDIVDVNNRRVTHLGLDSTFVVKHLTGNYYYRGFIDNMGNDGNYKLVLTHDFPSYTK
jgi:hypothetical protein